ncbi:MAG: hypothetical protein Kow00124_04190 [Anaerolineae bacterium]
MTDRRVRFTPLAALLAAFLLGGCLTIAPSEEVLLSVTINADGASRQVQARADATVSDVLREAGIVLGDLDRVNPPGYTRVSDGMAITVVRVTEETTVIQEVIPFERRTTLNDGLPPGETRMLQAGVNGRAEVTVRITYEDGVEVARSEIRRVLIQSPQDEIVMIGSQSDLPTVTVRGTLAYISGGNAWVMTQNSANRRPLTLDGGLDGRVFELSPDGRRLLFSRAIGSTGPAAGSLAPPQAQPTGAAGGEDFNSLWVVFDVTNPDSTPVRLDLNNVLYADWAPGDDLAILYSTAEPRPGFPGWQANNDLWWARVNQTGGTTGRTQLLETSGGGIYGWFGTFFELAPDGSTLAWAQPDAVGVLLAAGDGAGRSSAADNGPLPPGFVRQTLVTFAPRNPYDFVWVPGLSWSPDGRLLATTVHGPPLAGQNPEDSEIFDVTILPRQGGYSVTLAERAGLWASPRFSPVLQTAEGEQEILLAYLQAIDALSSQSSRYRLIIADRDGSNARMVFPPDTQPGLLPTDQDFTWAPSGRQIALTYQGSLYILDVDTGAAQQLTADGLTSSPRWTP